MMFKSNLTSVLLSLCMYSTFALTSPPALAGRGGGMDTGGGDPMQIEAVRYPDSAGLAQAMDIVQAKVSASTYPEYFKASLLSEMRSLKDADKYRMLSSLIILGPGSGPEGYNVPQDAYRFIALGGMTEIKTGAPVYFSERVTHYSTDELAKVLLHEIIHHVVSQGLSEDEVYVNDLTGSILSGVQSEALAKSFIYSSYFRKDFISKKQFLDCLYLADFGWLIQRNATWYLGDKGKDKLMQVWRERLEKTLPENLADLPVDDVRRMIPEALYVGYSDYDLTFKAYTPVIMKNLAKVLNPSGPELNLGYFGCRKDFRGFLSIFNKKCEGNDIIRMRDAYVPGN